MTVVSCTSLFIQLGTKIDPIIFVISVGVRVLPQIPRISGFPAQYSQAMHRPTICIKCKYFMVGYTIQYFLYMYL